jgi:hypothetical protein
MNISGIFNSTYSNTINNIKQAQNVDTVSSATKTQSFQKPDAVSSATVKNGGDHFFDARA